LEEINEYLLFSNYIARRQIATQEINTKSSERIRERIYLEEKAICRMG